jgi:hypothetical protein
MEYAKIYESCPPLTFWEAYLLGSIRGGEFRVWLFGVPPKSSLGQGASTAERSSFRKRLGTPPMRSAGKGVFGEDAEHHTRDAAGRVSSPEVCPAALLVFRLHGFSRGCEG